MDVPGYFLGIFDLADLLGEISSSLIAHLQLFCCIKLVLSISTYILDIRKLQVYQFLC